ncbi:hypothetical protein SDC9_198266 [bioreactor metagenome]|uniref:Uncharacterized protein n=1 Tax=bioreactor metagenome TaxID=1076179 RepID=A0A645IQK4_9ZZZZ
MGDRRQRAQLPKPAGQHVLAHRQAGHQVMVLEHHRRLLRQIAARVRAAQIDAAHRERAAVGLDQPVHAAQKRGLARARQAQHHHKLARAHVEVDAVQHMIAAISLLELTDADHFMLPRSSLSTLAVWRTTS